jgi:hypothetical protein
MRSPAAALSERPERSIADVARRANREAKPITEQIPKVKPARPYDLVPPYLRAYGLNEADRELEA